METTLTPSERLSGIAASDPGSAGADMTRLGAVAEFGRLALTTSDIGALMQRATEVVVEGLSADRSLVLELVPGRKTFRIRAGKGWSDRDTSSLEINATPETQAGYALALNAPVVIEDFSTEERFEVHPALRNARVSSGISVVIQGLTRPMGVMSLHSMALRRFTPSEVDFVQAIANTLGAAMQREKFEESNRARAHMLDEIGSAVTAVDPRGLVTYWNRRAEQMFGYTRAEAMGRRIAEVMPHPAVEAAEKEIADTIALGERWEGEWVAHRKDGSTLAVLSTATPIFDSWGQLESVVGVSLDVSDVNRMKSALTESERRFTAAFQDSVTAMSITSPTGRYLEVNEAMCNMLGYKRDQLLSMSFQDITAPEDRADDDRLREALLAGESSTLQKQKRYIRRDGVIVWAQVSVTLVRDERGVPLYFIVLIQDITEQRKAEAARAELEERLSQSQRMEAIGRLAGGIAHDFNNLLVVVENSAAFLEAALDAKDPRRADVVNIQSAAERASQLVRRLLTFGGKEVVTPRIVDVNHAVSSLAKRLRLVLGESITLRIELGDDVPPVTIDPERLNQVISQLVSNARDATPRGGEVRISTERHDADDRVWAALTIRDNGAGIDEHDLPHVFEPFFTTKAPGEGTGLGLSTVYAVVDQAGGTVEIASEPGAGTTVTVALPEVDGRAVRSAPVAVPEEEADGATILVAEDEAGVREMVTRMLTISGYTVLPARSGREALAIARTHSGQIDLLLTDMVMPRMTGKELLEKIGAVRGDMKTLFMTGYSEDVLAGRGIIADTTTFLEKPFDVDQLLAAVRRALAEG
jgi:two-component system, cell cycle sensor histidine kinase and response regulator CckA